MFYDSEKLEREAALRVGAKMCAAARTAPKAKGTDEICTAFITGNDKYALADEVEKQGKENNLAFFLRDAENIRNSRGVVLIGTKIKPRGINPCSLCGFENCAACTKAGGRCALCITDLGIAVGSAVATAADERVDNRVFFTAGVATVELNLLGSDVKLAYGIPISIKGKNIFFDR